MNLFSNDTLVHVDIQNKKIQYFGTKLIMYEVKFKKCMYKLLSKISYYYY